MDALILTLRHITLEDSPPSEKENGPLCGIQLSSGVTILKKPHSTKVYTTGICTRDQLLFQYLTSFYRNTYGSTGVCSRTL